MFVRRCSSPVVRPSVFVSCCSSVGVRLLLFVRRCSSPAVRPPVFISPWSSFCRCSSSTSAVVFNLQSVFFGSRPAQQLGVSVSDLLYNTYKSRGACIAKEFLSLHLQSSEFKRVVCKGVFDEKKSIFVGPRSRSISGVTENGVQLPVLVNRGWVPRSLRDKFFEANKDVEQLTEPPPSTLQKVAPEATILKEVVRVVRGSEKPSIFVPANDPSSGQWFYVDVLAIAGSCGLPQNTIYLEDIDSNVNPSNPYPIPKDVNALIRTQ